MNSLCNLFKPRMKKRQTITSTHAQFKRDGNFASIIGLWRRSLGINSGVDERGVHWLATISILCYVLTTLSQVISLIQATNDSERMFECLSVILFCAMGLLKLNSLRGRQARWYSMLSDATQLEIQQLSNEDPTNVDYESEGEDDNTFSFHITKYTQKFASTSNLFSKIYLVTCVIYILSPFIEFAIKKVQGADILKYPHILPVWAPLDVFLPLYVITVLAEAIAAAYCVFVHTTFDLSVVGMMIYIRGQFVLLRDYCERIGGEGRKLHLCVERDLRAHFRISRCQRTHASVIQSVNELRGLTQSILGIYFNMATLTLCSVAVQVSSKQLSATQLFTLLQYMCASLIQLALFCNFGDAVINKSSLGLGEGPSGSAWWCLSPRVRREVALLGSSTSRACRLQAGPFYLVNLPAFIQIVRTTYSYYAVVAQKSDNNNVNHI